MDKSYKDLGYSFVSEVFFPGNTLHLCYVRYVEDDGLHWETSEIPLWCDKNLREEFSLQWFEDKDPAYDRVCHKIRKDGYCPICMDSLKTRRHPNPFQAAEGGVVVYCPQCEEQAGEDSIPF